MSSEVKAACVLAAVITFLIPVTFAGCYGCSKVQVSDGYRDGTIRKVSVTGVIWKTTEIEMIGRDVAVNPGETYRYTVSDRTLADKIRSIPPDQRVRLFYRKMGAMWVPNGETAMFVTQVEPIQ